MDYGLQRFIEAQNRDYEIALLEIKHGRKLSHWMWYIFPQIQGLGSSTISNYYAIKNSDEARAYLDDEYLANNIINICNELLKLKTNNPVEIFGEIDAMKLKSSMTLFNYICEKDDNKINIFSKVLDKYFNGEKDYLTIKILTENKYL